MVIVGTHTSIAKGPQLAFGRSADVGGETLQIFAKSPRGWKMPAYTQEQIAEGKKMREDFGQKGGLVHSNYLANLSKTPGEIDHVVDSILHDFMIASELGYDAVNVHIGKLKDKDSLDHAMIDMKKNVEHILQKVEENGYGHIQFLFENTAGQGSEIGSTLEEISYFFQNYLRDLPVKFCIDTAHCWGGGIDLADWEGFIAQWDKDIGIEQLYCIHLNDAKVPLGAHLDRHASLGHGFIGRPILKNIIQRADTNQRNLYIETPEPERRSDEVEKVRKIAKGDVSRIDAEHEAVYRTQFLKKYADLAEQKGLF